MRTYGKKVRGKPHKLSPAEIVIEAFGGTVKMAEILGVSPQSVSNWKSRKGVVPAKYRQDLALYVAHHKEIKLDGRYIWAKENGTDIKKIPTESN